MRLIVILLVFISSISLSQNLVPNPSFEEIKDTITLFTDGNYHFDKKLEYWTAVNTASPDLITLDFDEKFIKVSSPHSGNNMVGIQSDVDYWAETNHSGEYIGVRLSKELIPNRTYYVEYWIRRAICINPKMNIDQFMNQNFGILFYLDTLLIDGYKMILAEPQIKVDNPLLVTDIEWVKVSKYFTPKSRFNKICIGQFWKNDEPKLMKGYYQVDDIVVEELEDFGSYDKNLNLNIGTIVPLNQINFNSGSATLQDQKSYIQLKELVSFLNSNPLLRVRVNGHTDSIGDKGSNLKLSKKRAKFIAKFIIQSEIKKDRVEWEGFGDGIPIDDNITEVGRSRNRRVEIEIID